MFTSKIYHPNGAIIPRLAIRKMNKLTHTNEYAPMHASTQPACVCRTIRFLGTNLTGALWLYFIVYADGSICLDILKSKWTPVYDVSAILTSIQV